MFRLLKYFRNFKGLSFSVPELLREDTYATDMANVRLTENLGISKRRGFQITAISESAGSVSFNNTDIATGTQVSEKFVFTNNLGKVTKLTTLLTDTVPTSAQAEMTLNPETQTFEFKLYKDGILNKTINLGTGLEGVPYLLSDLRTEINLDPQFNMAAVSSGVPAAFIDTFLITDIGSGLTINYSSVTNVTTPASASNPFAGAWATRTSDTFQNYSTIQANNCLYITNRIDGLFKYDGLKVYKAGLPTPSATITRQSVGTTNTYTYITRFRYIDNQGNTIYSTPLETTITTANAISNAASSGVDFDVPKSILDGFDKDTYVGDRGMYLEVYRTANGGTIFYEIYNNKINTDPDPIIEFEDETTDASLLGRAEFTQPVRNPDVPPKCQYITLWKNLIVLTGQTASATDPDAGNRVWIADVENIEGFNILNSVDVVSKLGQANSGIIGQDAFLYVHKPTAIALITGDPVQPATLSIDFLSESGIGALSHHSIIEAEGQVYFIARNGIYNLSTSGPQIISNELNPLFFNYTYTQNRCQAFYWPNERKLIFHLPVMDSNVNDLNDAITLVYDLYTQSWQRWNNLDVVNGMNLDFDKVWFAGSSQISSFLFTSSFLDYADHDKPISLVYKTHWENVGEPSIEKNFLRVKVYNINSQFQIATSSGYLLNIETEHDYVEDATVSSLSIDLRGNSGGWGNFSWGNTPWAETAPKSGQGRLLDRKARSLRLVLSNNNIHENVLISGLELEISAPYGAKVAR